jgi:hypothetical protein
MRTVPLGPACQPVPLPSTVAVAHWSASGSLPCSASRATWPLSHRMCHNRAVAGHCCATALSHVTPGAPSSFSVPALHAAPSRTPYPFPLPRHRAAIKRTPAVTRPTFRPVPQVHVRVPRSLLHRPLPRLLPSTIGDRATAALPDAFSTAAVTVSPPPPMVRPTNPPPLPVLELPSPPSSSPVAPGASRSRRIEPPLRPAIAAPHR